MNECRICFFPIVPERGVQIRFDCHEKKSLFTSWPFIIWKKSRNNSENIFWIREHIFLAVVFPCERTLWDSNSACVLSCEAWLNVELLRQVISLIPSLYLVDAQFAESLFGFRNSYHFNGYTSILSHTTGEESCIPKIWAKQPQTCV